MNEAPENRHRLAKNGAAAGDRSGLSLVLDACGHFNPGVHAFFVHRERGCGKVWVCERTDGNDDAVFAILAGVVHRGTACGAEVERAPASGITDPNERVRSSGNGHRACGISRLRSEHAARSALAGQAVANGDANRVGRRDSRELAARATSNSARHLEACVSRGQIGLPQRPRIAPPARCARRPSMSSYACYLEYSHPISMLQWTSFAYVAVGLPSHSWQARPTCLRIAASSLTLPWRSAIKPTRLAGVRFSV
jgi:hypothetical protein